MSCMPTTRTCTASPPTSTIALPGWRDIDTALVLGAGGAARAVVLALVEAGIGEILVLNRTAARADVLAEHVRRRGRRPRPRCAPPIASATPG